MTATDADRAQCLAAHTEWGGLSRLDLGGLSLLQYPADSVESGGTGLWLRLLEGDRAVPVRVDDPAQQRMVTRYCDGFEVSGRFRSLAFSCRFSVHPDDLTWQWLVLVSNLATDTGDGEQAVSVDAVLTSDIALAQFHIVRINQYYVSQYLDLTPVPHPRWGQCLAVRQNMPGPRAPWALLGSFGHGVGWATDAVQLGPVEDGLLTGLRRRELPNVRLQHEHTLAVIADAAVRLGPGQTHRTGFFGVLVPDHPRASGSPDADWAPAGPLQASGTPLAGPEPSPSPTLFAGAAELVCGCVEVDRLSALVNGAVTVVEQHDGTWWEATGPRGEVLVSAAKDRAVLRPHGQLLRTGTSFRPDPDGLTTTVWLHGVFASHLTRGHVGRDPLLSATQGYLGLRRSQGLRIFVREAGSWRLLGRPSAWGLRPDAARWLYAWHDCVLEVVTTAAGAARAGSPAITVELRQLSGEPREVLVAAQLARAGEPTTAPGRVSAGGLEVSFDGTDAAGFGDGPLFADGVSRGLPWLTVTGSAPLTLTLTHADTPSPSSVEPVETAPVQPPPAERGPTDRIELRPAGSGPASDELDRLNAILPWFTHDALVHYLSPRGLEQFSGGGWGTRDVCQGPVGLLSAQARPADLRDLLLRVFAAQHERGDWPQAFDFLPPLSVGQPDAHGDVKFWPLLALGEYLEREGDAGLMAESVGFVGDHAATPPENLAAHLERALAVIEARTVPGSPLPAYGHGDWNDSLQPADPKLAAQMASTWTSVLQVQTLRALAGGLAAVHAAPELAQRASDLAERTEQALTRVLLVDDLLAGYGVFDATGTLEDVLVHPFDQRTGLHHGVLPWIHAISAELLTSEQTHHHLAALTEHLLAPDGVRLFDRPTPYRGGPMTVFQRAEAATFWGREIGLMYTHAHLRYAEALARVGDARGLFKALCLVNPIGVTDRIAGALPRQSTCYYSSSDAAFADRYDAAAHYQRSRTGEVALQGGWRVYSSGPGLFLRLVVECLLGVTRHREWLHLDPVLDPALDQLVARVPLPDRMLELTYRVTEPGFGVRRVRREGVELATEPLTNRYREAGVRLRLADLGAATEGVTALVVEVGAG